MKSYFVLFFLGLFLAQSLGQDDVDPQDVVEEETILCEDGRYVNGELRSSNETNHVNCTTRYRSGEPDPPRCQTKVEERTENGETKTIVVKNCKTKASCEINKERFNSRDCDEAEGKYFRICVSCCEGSNCNDAITDISQVAP